MSPTKTVPALQLSRLISAEPAEVFRAWTDPEQLRRWFGPEGTTISVADVDLTVGGRYRICIEDDDGLRHTASGEYREIDPPSRLAFTWDWEEEQFRMGIETLVTVDFLERDGATEVRITHELFPGDEARSRHGDGWTRSLNCLEELFR